MTKQQLKRKYYRQNFDGYFYFGSRGGCEYYYSPRQTKKLFRKWLADNMHRFHFKPYSKNRQHNEFYFEGIAKNIKLVMQYHSPEAMLYYANPLDDTYCCDHSVIAYVGCACYDKSRGYFDSDRIDEKHYTFFPTKEEMIIHEVFEPIIPFVNEKFVEGNVLSVYEGGWGESLIVSKERFQQQKAALLKRKEQYEDEVRLYAFDIFSGEVLEKIIHEGKPQT